MSPAANRRFEGVKIRTNTGNFIARTTADGAKAGPLVFEIVFDDALNRGADGSGFKGCTVVVQLEAEGLPETLAITAEAAAAARHEAEALACRAARQTIEKDLPAGVEPACLPTPVGRLPEGLEATASTLHLPSAAVGLVQKGAGPSDLGSGPKRAAGVATLGSVGNASAIARA